MCACLLAVWNSSVLNVPVLACVFVLWTQTVSSSGCLPRSRHPVMLKTLGATQPFSVGPHHAVPSIMCLLLCILAESCYCLSFWQIVLVIRDPGPAL